MNLVDSSGWIEFLNGGANAEWFSPPIRDLGKLIVPSLSIYEVYRHAVRTLGESAGNSVVGAMTQGIVIDLDSSLAIAAADISIEHKLAMADSIMLATAQAYDATFWTQDADFKGIAGVKYRAK